MYGLKLRSSSRESADLRSKRATSFATNAFTRCLFTAARSPKVEPGGAVSARATAVSAETVMPTTLGVREIVVFSNFRTTGRENQPNTASTAASCVIAPTGTSPTVTPSAITTGTGVVVVVGVVVVGGGVVSCASADVLRTAAARQASRSDRVRPERFTWWRDRARGSADRP